MQFLIQRGHNRLVPNGGLAEFPEAILNAKRLDLYNLYKEVTMDTCWFYQSKEIEKDISLAHFLTKCLLFRWYQGVAFM